MGAAGSNHVSLQQKPKLFKYHILQLFEVVENYLFMHNTISMYLKNLISLTMSMTNMDDY